MKYNKAEVYRKAAEILVRDGQYKGELVKYPEELGVDFESGACVRAEWELYQTFCYGYGYERYSFTIPTQFYMDKRLEKLWNREIWSYNDSKDYSAEDIALMLKQHAHNLEEESHDA